MDKVLRQDLRNPKAEIPTWRATCATPHSVILHEPVNYLRSHRRQPREAQNGQSVESPVSRPGQEGTDVPVRIFLVYIDLNMVRASLVSHPASGSESVRLSLSLPF